MVMFNNGTLCKTLPPGPPHSLTSIVRGKTKSGLITEEYTRPGLKIPVDTFTTKGQPRLAVSRGQSWGSQLNVWHSGHQHAIDSIQSGH